MPLAKPNYAFQKRQRELAKKQKKEEKRLRKSEPGSGNDDAQPGHGEAPADEHAPAGNDGAARPANDDVAKA